jgi:hypothetical protein
MRVGAIASCCGRWAKEGGSCGPVDYEPQKCCWIDYCGEADISVLTMVRYGFSWVRSVEVCYRITPVHLHPRVTSWGDAYMAGKRYRECAGRAVAHTFGYLFDG